ncbi:DUF58 domain-containing protein [Vibrio sp. IRLE0018]|uniref:DUF58 domain-containing protein n=1 Tax=Vibrio floridensis TaxID=2908007 RepID=UPI001A32A676|nr:DUF58 domain-containing protein [Vibrio floridensis]MCF8780062.1 DUF58 domain-containing protein [Vibrio floridensis]HAS6347426.1 DUF58 domain-containing protein [Vibrio vulnificus]
MSVAALPPFANGVTLSLDELIYYQSQSVRWLPPARSVLSVLSGAHASRQRGRGMDFEEVRQYQQGDDIRTIDWRVTARTGKAHTKLFSEDKEQAVILYIDLSSSMFLGSQYLFKSVQAAHLASVLLWTTLAKKDRLGALIDDGHTLFEHKPSALTRNGLSFLHQLAEQHNRRQTAHSEAPRSNGEVFERLKRMSPKGCQIIFLSDFVQFSEQELGQIGHLKQHNSVHLIQLYDPLESGQTDYRGQVMASNGKHSRWFDFGSKKQKMALKANFEQHQQRLQRLSYRNGIPFSTLSCAKPLINQLTA